MARTIQKAQASISGKDILLFVPRIGRLGAKLLMDSRVPATAKLKFAGSLAYVVLPFSLIGADGHPVLGVIDDIVIVMKGMRAILDAAGEQVLRDNWSGPQEQLDALVDTIRKGDDAINAFAGKIKELLTGGRPSPAPATR